MQTADRVSNCFYLSATQPFTPIRHTKHIPPYGPKHVKNTHTRNGNPIAIKCAIRIRRERKRQGDRDERLVETSPKIRHILIHIRVHG